MINKIICFIFFTVLLYGCKSGASKIDINDIEKHRAYQDSAIAKGKNGAEQINIIKELISEYRNLKLDTNSNYNYYLGRLYSNIFSFSDNFLFDSVNKKLKNPYLYSNYVDSTIYFNELALNINPNNLFAIFKLANAIEDEQDLFRKRSKEYKNMPFFPDRNNAEYQKVCNYIINNSLDFLKIDTSSDKYKSRYIIEDAFLMLASSMKNSKVDIDNETTIAQILKIQNLIMAIDKFSQLVLLQNNYYKTEKSYWEPIIAQAKIVNEQNQKENERILNIHNLYRKELFNIKFSDNYRGVFSYLILHDDGEYEFGYDDGPDNGNLKCTKRAKFDGVDENTIILHNYFDNPAKDVRFRLTLEKTFGFKNFYLRAYMDNGQLYSGDDMYFISSIIE